MREKLGFIGLGLMGTAMVLRLLERGWPVTVWNRDPLKLAPVTAAGAVAAASPRAVAEQSDIVLLCVLNAEAVASCLGGPEGITASTEARLVIDCSTTDPTATLDFAARLRGQTGGGWVDAPVSGGPHAARTGTLTIMAGGSGADFSRASPVLADLGRNVTRMGEVGAGQSVKMINQLIVGTGFAVMAEALALTEASGVDAAHLAACLAGGLADSRLLQVIYPQMQTRDFDPPRSHARVLLKDLRAIAARAEALGLTLPLVSAAEQLFAAHAEAGHAMDDSATIIQRYRKEPRAN